MERGRLKQQLSKAYRASLRSPCSISSRNVTDTVQEPVFVCRRQVNKGGDINGQELFLQVPDRSLSCSRRPPPMTRVTESKSKEEEEVGDWEGRTCPPPYLPVSPSYYCFKQMKEELERVQRRISRHKEIRRRKKKKTKKKLLSNSYGFTSSSSEEDSGNDDGVEVLFSSDRGRRSSVEGRSSKEREGETETLFSSRTFSSDSSEFYYSSSRPRNRSKKKTSQRQETPAREHGGRSRHRNWDDALRPLVSISSSSSSPSSPFVSGAARTEDMAAEVMEEEAGRAGFAVEKQSSDPHEDFQSSMLEMIMEKQMFGAGELEKLLLCYLSLNSPRHHPIILGVFSEIWETLFA